MSIRQRVFRILTGLLMFLLAIVITLDTDVGYVAVIGIFSVALTVYGIYRLYYYFTMARFMVGGRSMLYIGIIMLDLGIFTSTLAALPQIFIIVYLILTYALTGVFCILRGIEAKRYDSPSWMGNLIYGFINVAVVLLSLIFVRSLKVLLMIFAIGLLYSAVLRVISAFRKTEVVYIQ